MKKCSYCGHQNEDLASTCTACGKVFENPPATRGEGADLRDSALDPVIVGTFENTEHAGVLKAKLEDAGIEAWIPEDYSFEFPPQTASVQVAAKDAPAAREIADEFHKARGIETPTASGPDTKEKVDLADSSAGLVPNSRQCVSCGAPIPYDAVLCPKCGWTQPQLV